MLNAEVEVTTLLLPELLKVFTGRDVKFEVVCFDFHRFTAQFIKIVFSQAQLTESELSTLLLHPRVDQLEFGVFFAD